MLESTTLSQTAFLNVSILPFALFVKLNHCCTLSLALVHVKFTMDSQKLTAEHPRISTFSPSWFERAQYCGFLSSRPLAFVQKSMSKHPCAMPKPLHIRMLIQHPWCVGGHVVNLKILAFSAAKEGHEWEGMASQGSVPVGLWLNQNWYLESGANDVTFWPLRTIPQS